MRKSFVYVFPLMCVLNSYASGIPGLSISSVLLCFYICYDIYDSIRNNKRQRDFGYFIMLFFCIIFISLIDYFYRDIESYSAIVINLFKLIIWGSGSTLLVQNCSDITKLVRNYVYVSFICSIYLYIQTILYYGAGVFLPNVYSFGPLNPLYKEYSWDYKNYVEAVGMARPASFMNEPAFYCGFICITLALILFDAHDIAIVKRHKGIVTLFFALSIVLSTSTSGMIFAAIILMVYFITSKKNNNALIMIILSLITVLILSNDNLVGFIESNKLYQFTAGKLFNMSGQARVGNGLNLLETVHENDLLFGYGYGNVKTYSDYEIINSSVTILLSTGIIGVGCWLAFIILMIKNYRNVLSILFIMLFVIASLGSGVLNLQGIYYIGIAVGVSRIKNVQTNYSL